MTIFDVNLNEFIADVLYNLGISLWGFAVAIFLLEVLVEREAKKTEEWFKFVQKRLSESNEPKQKIS